MLINYFAIIILLFLPFMGQICHHTTENWGNKRALEKDGPVYGTGADNYFGPGYYFWDNNLKHAEWWGRKRYNGNYYVFEADVEIDKNRMFDTTDRNDIDYLKRTLAEFIDNDVDLTSFYLGTVLSLLLEEEAKTGKVYFPYLYAKGVDDNAKKNVKIEFNQSMLFSERAKSAFFLNPVVFFCIFRKENVNLRSFSLVSEQGSSVK